VQLKHARHLIESLNHLFISKTFTSSSQYAAINNSQYGEYAKLLYKLLNWYGYWYCTVIILKKGTDGIHSAVRACSNRLYLSPQSLKWRELGVGFYHALHAFWNQFVQRSERGFQWGNREPAGTLTSRPNHHEGEKYKRLLWIMRLW
jgi:hypothetical protein